MNTVMELESKGINKKTAEIMIEKYKQRIGTIHGDFIISDITYLGNDERDVVLTCKSCKNSIHKVFNGYKNKWGELKKHCDYCKEADLKNSPKIKKAIRNDDPEYLGMVFGDFKVIAFDRLEHKNKSGGTIRWLCECIHCNFQSIKTLSSIKKGVHCFCQKESVVFPRMEYIGQKFNRLTVIDFDNNCDKSHHIYAICKCECGNDYKAQFQYVKDGTIKSCGCLSREIQEKRKQEYHKTSSPLYRTWNGMKQRCSNPNTSNWNDYGGRGITVCDEWRNSFETFETWCYDNGYRPKEGLSLDRIDVNKGYSPDNCRFASVYVQRINQRPNKRNLVEINGVSKTKKEWLEEYGIYEATVRYRMKKMGMTFEEALVAEKQTKGNHLAALNLPKASKQSLYRLNSCNSYIETNLYMAFLRNSDSYLLIPQFKVDNYKVDFLVENTKIVIECDGHDYHKTPEQLYNDCKRERQLILSGYTVLRFSGKEINNNPDECAREIIEFIKKNEVAI